MNKESFYTMKSVSRPNDVKSAISLLSDLVRKTNDADLLLRVGAIQGTYAVYERTNDTTLLEQLIVDIVLLLQDMVNNSAADFYFDKESPLNRSTDLIYTKTDIREDTIPIEKLIAKFTITKKFESATKSIYTSALNTVCRALGITSVSISELNSLSLRIVDHVQAHPEYNRNTRSAANGFVKFLRVYPQTKQSED